MKITSLKINKNTGKIKNFFVTYKTQILITVFFLFLSFLFILNSSKYMLVVLEGIILYGTKILPSLLPFFFITKILSSFDFIYYVCNNFKGLTKFLFNTKAISSYIFFMSIISGYPMGAKLTSDFYEKGILNKTDCQKILSFCSTSGPLFIIGSVGVGFFGNEVIGLALFLSHILSSIINGIVFRNVGGKLIDNIELKQDKKTLSLEDCMYNSIKSVLIVGGYIVIFYVLIQIMLDFNLLYPLIKLFNLLGLSNLEAQGLSAGIIEITKGTFILSKCENVKLAFILSSGLISFSGISILIQSLTFLDKTKVNKKLFILQKITHAIFSVFVSYLISCFIF